MPDENEPELTPEELEDQEAEELPNREAMSVIPYPGDWHTLPVEPPTDIEEV
jgi:hypothetical protein